MLMASKRGSVRPPSMDKINELFKARKPKAFDDFFGNLGQLIEEEENQEKSTSGNGSAAEGTPRSLKSSLKKTKTVKRLPTTSFSTQISNMLINQLKSTFDSIGVSSGISNPMTQSQSNMGSSMEDPYG